MRSLGIGFGCTGGGGDSVSGKDVMGDRTPAPRPLGGDRPAWSPSASLDPRLGSREAPLPREALLSTIWEAARSPAQSSSSNGRACRGPRGQGLGIRGWRAASSSLASPRTPESVPAGRESAPSTIWEHLHRPVCGKSKVIWRISHVRSASVALFCPPLDSPFGADAALGSQSLPGGLVMTSGGFGSGWKII